MSVIGPEYSKDQAYNAYRAIKALLRDKYGIQKLPPIEFDNWQKDRDARNLELERAIHSLFELESWESW